MQPAAAPQRGIALIQALLIAGMLGLLTLTVAVAARQHVALARTLEARTVAELEAQTLESRLAYSMLTTEWLEKPIADDPTPDASWNELIASAWNFRGLPFTVGEATVTLQDENGRLRIPWNDARDIVALLRELGVDPRRAERLAAQLLELQSQGYSKPATADTPSGTMPGGGGEARFPVQRVDELRLLRDMDEGLYLRLRPLLTTYPTPGFNPLTAAPPLLASRLPASVRLPVLEAARRGELDADRIFRLAGIEADEQLTMLAGPAFTMSIEVRRDELSYRRTGLLVLYPYRKDALIVWSRSTPPSTP